MRYSVFAAASVAALGLAFAGAAHAQSNSTNGNLGLLSAIGNQANTNTTTNTDNSQKNDNSSHTDASLHVDDNTLLLGNTWTDDSTHISVGNVSLSVNTATNNQTLNGNVSGNGFNMQANQAAAAGGNGGDGGNGIGIGLLAGIGAGAGGGAGAAGAASSGNNQPVYTGDVAISGAAYQSFAGIQTASYNTGLGSNVQSNTGVAANANVTFGHN